MSYGITATQAKVDARADSVIVDEVHTLMKQVIADAQAGNYSTTMSDGTTMTESTPATTITGTVTNPTITGTPTLIVAGSTITLGTSGTNLNAVIADINDAAVTGLVASKSANKLVLTYTHTAGTAFNVVIGAGTANTDLGLTAQTYTATNPSSTTYYNVWKGTQTDRAKTDQMNEVIEYFKGLGYHIERQNNTTTTSTFKWVITW